MKAITILIDKREKQPLPFPPVMRLMESREPVQIVTRESHLETGDYQLADHPTAGCVERKKHAAELWTNLTVKRGNFIAELERMARYTHPLILIEASPQSMRREYVRVKRKPEGEKRPRVVEERIDWPRFRGLLLEASTRYHVPIQTIPGGSAGNRLAIAEWVVEFLVRASHGHHQHRQA